MDGVYSTTNMVWIAVDTMCGVTGTILVAFEKFVPIGRLPSARSHLRLGLDGLLAVGAAVMGGPPGWVGMFQHTAGRNSLPVLRPPFVPLRPLPRRPPRAFQGVS